MLTLLASPQDQACAASDCSLRMKLKNITKPLGPFVPIGLEGPQSS